MRAPARFALAAGRPGAGLPVREGRRPGDSAGIYQVLVVATGFWMAPLRVTSVGLVAPVEPS